MPSNAYKRLTTEKKKRIIEGAIKEFSIHSLEHASLNAVANNAGMSRTTLYYYFADIDDIFMTVMDEVMENFKKSINLAEREQIDIFEIYYLFFRYVTSYKNTELEAFVKTIFSDMSLKLQKIITEPYIQYFLENKKYLKNLENSLKTELTIKDYGIHFEDLLIDGPMLSLTGHGDLWFTSHVDAHVRVNLLSQETWLGKGLHYLLFPLSKIFELQVYGPIKELTWTTSTLGLGDKTTTPEQRGEK